MNPLVKRGGAAAEIGRPPSGDAPSQVVPAGEESPPSAAAEDGDERYRGELFLPGWLKIERDPSADQGPGG